LDSNTHVLPVIGPLAEKTNDFIGKKVEDLTIKLPPKKIFKLELLEAERTFTPNFVRDHFGIWTSPLRTKYKDLIWLLPASGILTALFLTDNDFSGALTNNHKPTRLERDISNAFGQIGGYGPTLGVPGGLIVTGFLTKNDRMRETGVLQYKAIAHASLLFLAVSRIAGRNKPNNARKGKGEFFEGGTSFPSGHVLNSFTSASVLAHEYSDKPWVGIIAYTLSSLVAGSRVTQAIHFPSDVFVSVVAGILIGRYVVEHNSKYAPSAKENNKTEQ
jgi:membrane-associated phospholipid phosphatase